MIKIDGASFEGGGALVRVAIGLSVLTQRPIEIYNIRAKRSKPGLHTQLVQSIEAAKKLCSGKVKGVSLGSKQIEFYPDEIKESSLTISVPTAASAGLILQLLQLACSFAPKTIEININGGADFGKFAPAVPYLQNVTLPILERMGLKIELKTLRHAFYPKGGGTFNIKIHPAEKLKSIQLKEQGKIIEISGFSIATKHLEKAKVADRQAESASTLIEKELGIKPKIEIKYCESYCPGSGLVLWLKTDKGTVIGSDITGEIGLKSETIGYKAAKELIDTFNSGATVDSHLSDQLIPFTALADGKSIFKTPRLTMHAKTNIWLVKKFLPLEFNIKENNIVEISCNGIGFSS